MQDQQPVPADTSLNLLDGFTLSNQDPHGLAVQWITRFQFANRERSGECGLTHGCRLADSASFDRPAGLAMPPKGGNPDADLGQAGGLGRELNRRKRGS
jgi:hypothetical protein